MDESFLNEYEAFERRHWWFVARREIILRAIDRHAPTTPTGGALPRWLDIGCGTGVLLAARPQAGEKVGVEVDPGNVARAIEKGLDVRRVEREWDFAGLGTFDLITLCDVIEHVPLETPAIDAVYGALRPGGVALVTVPALQSLWGRHDEINHHCRRYTRRTLLPLFPLDRWDVLRVTYFSSLLLPLIWAARTTKRLRGRDTGHDLKFGPRWLDAALLAIFRLERPWLSVASFPLGSSLLLVCRKRETAQSGRSTGTAEETE